jgi:hypothetical protein
MIKDIYNLVRNCIKNISLNNKRFNNILSLYNGKIQIIEDLMNANFPPDNKLLLSAITAQNVIAT